MPNPANSPAFREVWADAALLGFDVGADEPGDTEKVKSGRDEICSEAGTVAVAAGIVTVTDERLKLASLHKVSYSARQISLVSTNTESIVSRLTHSRSRLALLPGPRMHH